MEILIIPLRLSMIEGKKFKEVNLFFITMEKEKEKEEEEWKLDVKQMSRENGKDEQVFDIVSHYCVISSLSRLLCRKVYSKSKVSAYVCRKCCNSFKSQEDLDKHVPCMSNTFDRYPEPGTLLRFKNFKNTVKVPFTFIFDFESFLETIIEKEQVSKDEKIAHIQEHVPSAFALHCLSNIIDYQPNPIVRVKKRPDENMVIELFNIVKKWTHEIYERFKDGKPLIMSARDEYIFQE